MLEEQAQQRTASFQTELHPQLARTCWGLLLGPLRLSCFLCEMGAGGDAAPACLPRLCKCKP